MKTATHNGRPVAIIHKTGKTTRIAPIILQTRPEGAPLRRLGPQEVVASVEVIRPTIPALPHVKRELSQDDINRLAAARGLPRSILSDAKPDRSGLLPSVMIYNLSIKMGKLIGAAIVPVGSPL